MLVEERRRGKEQKGKEEEMKWIGRRNQITIV